MFFIILCGIFVNRKVVCAHRGISALRLDLNVSLMFNIYFKEMKKFFSLIALVGVFAACEPENLQTAFNVPDATATLNVTVISAAPARMMYMLLPAR